MVENPTDEDWTGVQMALMSGRPICFKMDLYQPLYVPRPTVEPELFASLRPQTYDGDMDADSRAGRARAGRHARPRTRSRSAPAGRRSGGVMLGRPAAARAELQ